MSDTGVLKARVEGAWVPVGGSPTEGGGGAVDCADCDSRFVNATGDAMTGPLELHDAGSSMGSLAALSNGVVLAAASNPTQNRYVQLGIGARVFQLASLSTGVHQITSSFPILLNAGAPTDPAHATRKDYVDAQVATRLTQADADTRFVNTDGDEMTGPLVITAPLDMPLLVNGSAGMILGASDGIPSPEVYVRGNLYAEQGSTYEIGRRTPLPHAGLVVFGAARISADNPLPITDALQLTTKQYVDGKVGPAVQFRGERATASYPSGADTPIQPISTLLNTGGFDVTNNQVSVPEDGTYAVSASIGGAVLSAGSCIQMSAGSHGAVAFPSQGGTTWRNAGTLVVTLLAGQAITFVFRSTNAAAVSLMFQCEVIKVDRVGPQGPPGPAATQIADIPASTGWTIPSAGFSAMVTRVGDLVTLEATVTRTGANITTIPTATIFNLPVGFRPTTTVRGTGVANGAFAAYQLTAAGDLTLISGPTAINTNHALSISMSFRAAP